MVTWNNLDTLTSYAKLKDLKDHVDIKEAMAGENGAERVAKYTAPMAEGLSFNYAAKQVDDTVLTALTELAEEAQLAEKFEELYNGAVINRGEWKINAMLLAVFNLIFTRLKLPVRISPRSDNLDIWS